MKYWEEMNVNLVIKFLVGLLINLMIIGLLIFLWVIRELNWIYPGFTYILQIFLVFYWSMLLVAKDDQYRGRATISLPTWQKWLLFLHLPNIFEKRIILYQKTLMIGMVTSIGLMVIIPFRTVHAIIMFSYLIFVLIILPIVAFIRK